MSDRKMISQLKALRRVQPNEDWVALTKKRVIKGHDTTPEHSHSPAFLFGSVAFAVVLLLGIFGFTNVIDIGVPNVMPKQNIALYDYRVLVSSLQDLENDIARATTQLKGVMGPEKVLEVMTMVDGTVKDGENLVSNAKRQVKRLKVTENGDKEPEGMVYSAMTEVENVENKVVEMKDAYKELQKEITKQQIVVLRASILTENQRDLLKDAERYYEDGDYIEALMKVIEASQIR